MKSPPKILAIGSSYSENASGIFDGYECTATLTLTLHSPATRDRKFVFNTGSGVVTVATAGDSATIDGGSTITVPIGAGVELVANGLTGSSAAWRTVNALDAGVIAGTVSAGKSVVVDANKDVSSIRALGVEYLRPSSTGLFQKQSAPTAKTDGNATMTAAEMINGIIVHTVSTGRTLTTPTGAAISAGCPAGLAVGDSFDLHVITVGTGSDDISTLTAGDGAVTFVGNVTVGPDSSTFNGYGTFRFRLVSAGVWIGYRIG